jgi:hypothetical protein
MKASRSLWDRLLFKKKKKKQQQRNSATPACWLPYNDSDLVPNSTHGSTCHHVSCRIRTSRFSLGCPKHEACFSKSSIKVEIRCVNWFGGRSGRKETSASSKAELT